jgi:hypothetical protein
MARLEATTLRLYVGSIRRVNCNPDIGEKIVAAGRFVNLRSGEVEYPADAAR